ncbi:hypothetical protein KC842_02840 [Candidatus Nomurabacteria bacterium]|nr:hypothetical protein [Candidatus Nomurabacteria bacterium]
MEGIQNTAKERNNIEQMRLEIADLSDEIRMIEDNEKRESLIEILNEVSHTAATIETFGEKTGIFEDVNETYIKALLEKMKKILESETQSRVEKGPDKIAA